MIRQNAARILINSRFNFVSTNKRWKATKTADEADEWGRAKPFEQMPGKKSRSMVKSLWSLLRAIGITTTQLNQVLKKKEVIQCYILKQALVWM